MALAVINMQGQIWSRDLDLRGGNIGAGVKVPGPSLFSETNADQFVVARVHGFAYIYVITNTGPVFVYHLGQTDGRLYDDPPGGSVYAPDSPTKYLLLDSALLNVNPPGRAQYVFVINNAGEIWAFELDFYSYPVMVPKGKLNGPSLFYTPDDKYVVSAYTDFGTILVVNTQGEVWAHDLSTGKGDYLDSVSVGYKLGGPSLFGGPNDKYVVYYGGYLLVINTLGEVWSHVYDGSEIGAGIKLNGPGLFGSPDDKYVIAF